MMLVSIDPARRRVGVVSIPRDSRVEIEGHGTDKINSAHAFGGPELSVSTVRNTFLVQIDHYVVIDTQGLKRLFEALGPVQVLVEKPMHYRDRTAGLNVDLQPGLQTLDPVQAEEYVRYRHDARGDIGRMERQQWFLRQVAHKLKEPQIILKLPELIAFARDNVVTDMTADDMVRALSFLKDLEPTQVATATMPGVPQMIAGGSYWVPDMEQSRKVLDRLIGTGLLSATSFDAPEQQAAIVDASTTGDTAVVKPMTVSIRYPKGLEETAQNVAQVLTDNGYVVRYRWQIPEADCQHEQINQNSERADEIQTDTLRKALPDIKEWPVVISIESRPVSDFTLTISPSTTVSSATQVVSSPVNHHLDRALAN
jgi:LCP family protein required for cell wall assembly